MENKPPIPQKEKTPAPRLFLFLLAGNTILSLCSYQILLHLAAGSDQPIWTLLVMLLYAALTVGFLLAYLIYNRFLYRKGLTPEQLPEAWSEQQKHEFLADSERRLKKSRWMMLIIFPLIVTFLYDAIDLFLIDALLR